MSNQEDYIKKLEETNALLQKKLDEFRQTPHPDCEKLTVGIKIDPIVLNNRGEEIEIIKRKLSQQLSFEMTKRMKIVSFVEQYSGIVCYQAEIWVMKDCE